MRKIFLFAIIITTQCSIAQDPHFTQFYSAPLTVNPAYTGVFSGNMRLISNVRSQWTGSSSPFNTVTFGMDGKIGKNKTDGQHPFNIGVLLMHDNSLNGVVQSNYATLAGSYHIPLDEDAFKTLGIGFTGIYGDRRVNVNKISFGNQFSNNGFDLTLPSGEQGFNSLKSYFTGGAGLLYQNADDNSGSYFDIGLSCYNFNKPKQTLISDPNQYVPIRFSGQVSYQRFLGDNYLVFIRGIYQNQAANQYYQAGVLFERLLGVSQEYSIGAGGWYRSKDAVSPYLKLGVKNLFIGFTYDITMSDLKAASGYNSMELSLQYIVNKKKSINNPSTIKLK